jgi:diguanylate cyclase (GGDEF)-like protein/PAS domain S-box-containing protein
VRCHAPPVTRGREELATAFLRSTRALAVIVGADNRIVLANPAMEAFTGIPAAELEGRFFHDVYVVPEHRLLAQDAVARSMATGLAYPQEGDWLAAGGVRRRIAMQIDVLRDGEGRPWALACFGVDVTAEREREARLHRRAQTDLLTGLSNRSALFEELERQLDPATGDGCGLVFCDLDLFKEVNDRYGHPVGDQLLVEVARRLAGLAGTSDLAARLGGDEFVLLCGGVDESRLTGLAEAVVDRFRTPFRGPAGDLTIGISVGVATGRPGEAPDELVARADRAMYGVKSRRTRHGPRPAGDD